MSPRRFRPPIHAGRDGAFTVDIGAEESALVRRLVRELRAMLTADEPSGEVATLLRRLFPVVHPDDDELEAEYQRLMRDELVQSKLAAFDVVEDTLGDDGAPGEVDEAGLVAFMQSLNSIRLVLGTMLGVSDEPDGREVAVEHEDSPEYALYAYLSYLLEHSVQALGSAG